MYVGITGATPYAAAITFSQIACPAIRRAAGGYDRRQPTRDTISPVADFDYDRRIGRREYVPVTWEARDSFWSPRSSSASVGAALASLAPDVVRS